MRAAKVFFSSLYSTSLGASSAAASSAAPFLPPTTRSLHAAAPRPSNTTMANQQRPSSSLGTADVAPSTGVHRFRVVYDAAHPVTSMYRQIGLGIGQQTRQILQKWITNDKEMTEMKEWIEEDPENQVMVEDFRRATQTAFPEYWEELEGMAEGSGLKVEDLFLSNLRGEVQQFSDAMTTPLKSCTDVFVDARIHAGGEGFVGYGHNDDWGMDWKKPGYHFDYFIEVYEKAAGFQFASFYYPGFMAGMDFVLNKFGLTMTVNSLFPSQFARSGVSMAFVSRAIIEKGDSIEKVVELLSDDRLSTGGSWNVGSVLEKRMVNIETQLGGKPTVFEVPAPGVKDETPTNYFHANEYRHSPGTEFRSDPSTEHRYKVFADKYDHLAKEKDIRTFLADRSDADYPVFRAYTKVDPTWTLMSGVFDLTKGTLSLYPNIVDMAAKPAIVWDYHKLVGSSSPPSELGAEVLVEEVATTSGGDERGDIAAGQTKVEEQRSSLIVGVDVEDEEMLGTHEMVFS